MNIYISRLSHIFFIPLSCLLFLLINNTIGNAQPEGFNYDESKVPKYELPDPLRLNNGLTISDAGSWYQKRRPEIVQLFEQYVYGKSPDKPENLLFEITSIEKEAFGGTAIRKEISVYLTGKKDGPTMNILIYLPKDQTGPSPIFVGLNFYGNHSSHNDPGITLSKQWIRNSNSYGVIKNRATEDSRGKRSSRWPVEKIIDRGYGLATIYYGDIDPDFDDGFKNYNDNEKNLPVDQHMLLALIAPRPVYIASAQEDL